MGNCCNIRDDGSYYKAETKAGEKWTPFFIEYVDPEKCLGCGKCVKVCSRGVYEMREANGQNIAVPVNAGNCVGDGSCHMACQQSAIVCKPRKNREGHRSKKDNNQAYIGQD